MLLIECCDLAAANLWHAFDCKGTTMQLTIIICVIMDETKVALLGYDEFVLGEQYPSTDEEDEDSVDDSKQLVCADNQPTVGEINNETERLKVIYGNTDDGLHNLFDNYVLQPPQPGETHRPKAHDIVPQVISLLDDDDSGDLKIAATTPNATSATPTTKSTANTMIDLTGEDCIPNGWANMRLVPQFRVGMRRSTVLLEGKFELAEARCFSAKSSKRAGRELDWKHHMSNLSLIVGGYLTVDIRGGPDRLLDEYTSKSSEWYYNYCEPVYTCLKNHYRGNFAAFILCNHSYWSGKWKCSCLEECQYRPTMWNAEESCWKFEMQQGEVNVFSKTEWNGNPMTATTEHEALVNDRANKRQKFKN